MVLNIMDVENIDEKNVNNESKLDFFNNIYDDSVDSELILDFIEKSEKILKLNEKNGDIND